MAGPYPPYRPSGAAGQPFPGPAPYGAEPYPYPVGYPGPLPPPVGFSTPPRSRRALWWSLLGVALAGALIATVLAVGASRSTGSAGFSAAASKDAIQKYLTALSDGDTETIARNNLCGMFDAVKDRKSDLALARLSSDAFGKQFDRTEVTSIDKIVPTSEFLAQVLFTMRVAPARTSRKARDEEQGVAQLLRQGDQLLVCSYLLRTAGQF